MNINPILILVSIWSGVIIFFSAVVAPTVFKSLGEKEAGMFLRAFFPKYYIFGGVIGITSIVYLLITPYFWAFVKHGNCNDTFNYLWQNANTCYQ